MPRGGRQEGKIPGARLATYLITAAVAIAAFAVGFLGGISVNNSPVDYLVNQHIQCISNCKAGDMDDQIVAICVRDCGKILEKNKAEFRFESKPVKDNPEQK